MGGLFCVLIWIGYDLRNLRVVCGRMAACDSR